MRPWALVVMMAGVACVGGAQLQEYGPWEVRRARTSDCDKAGQYPEWKVMFSGDERAPDVDITGDDQGKFRGHIFIGRRVKVPADRKLLALRFAYATHCDLPDRGGSWDVVAMPVASWEALGRKPKTEVIFARERAKYPVQLRVHGHMTDQDTPQPWDEMQSRVLALQLRKFQGQEIVLAAVWTGYHTTTEWGKLKHLEVTTVEPQKVEIVLFRRLDLDRPELARLKELVAAENTEAAKAELLRVMRERTEPALPGDPRQVADYRASPRALREADDALQHRMIGQPSYGPQQLGKDIDWHENVTPDPEWTWQLNRHSAWRALAQAYRATKDEKYAREFVAQLLDWIEDNPPGTPVSWRTLEAGIRAQGWMFVYAAFLDSPSFTPEAHLAMLNSFADHAEYLLPEQRFHSGSNWGLTEARGLMAIGMYFPEFKQAMTWRETGWSRIETEVMKQVYPDGAQVELSPSYHGGCIGGFYDAAKKAEAAGIKVSHEYWQRVEKMYEFLMYLRKPDDTQPMWGDAWPGSTSGALRSGARRFGRPDYLWVATAGKQGTPPPHLSYAFPYAGYHVMRSDWLDSDARYLCLDICPYGGGHSDADCLSFIMYAYGKTLMPDSGSYLYYGQGAREAWSTRAHSTIMLDEQNQNTSRPTVNAWHTDELFDFADGTHHGYKGVAHRRQVIFVRPDYWLVFDTVTGEGEHTVDQLFHFLPSELATDEPAGRVWTKLPQGPNVLLQALDRDGLKLEPFDWWVSWRYTEREDAPAISWRYQGPLPRRFATLLYPYRGGKTPAVKAELLALEGEADSFLAKVSTPEGTDYVFAAPEPRKVDAKTDEVQFVGRAGVLRLNRKGQVRACGVTDGEGVWWQGQVARP